MFRWSAAMHQSVQSPWLSSSMLAHFPKIQKPTATVGRVMVNMFAISRKILSQVDEAVEIIEVA